MQRMKWVTMMVVALGLSSALKGHEHCHHDHEEEFEWTAEKSALAEVDLVEAGPGTIHRIARLAGEVMIHPDHMAYVVPQVTGVVCEVRKMLGDVVQQGEVLALIESDQVAEAKTIYLKADKRLEFQKIRLQKEISLKGIAPEQDLLEAQLAYEEAILAVEGAQQKLYMLGFTTEEIGTIIQQPSSARRLFALKAPLAGRVLQRSLTLGEQVGEGTIAFTVANFEKVWVQMHVAPADVSYVQEGMRATISGVLDKQTEVTICQFEPTISEETRKARAIAVIQNGDHLWMPGEYVTISIETKADSAPVVVAREAVQSMKGENYIFVQQECGSFVPCLVKLGKMDHHHVEVVSGLKVGEVYASTNAFCLKADFQKEEVEHSH